MLIEGDMAPGFTLANQYGKQISLNSFLDKKVIIYFYPKDHTPGCTKQACDFRDAEQKFQHKDTIILGISRDPLSKHLSFAEKFALPFSLLTDEHSKVCESFGVLQEKSMFGKKYSGIVRSTFLIDEQGKIAKIWRNISVIGHINKILKYL